MPGKSNIHRRIWYFRKRNARRIYVYIKLAVFLAVLILIMGYIQGVLMPYMIEISSDRTKAIITSTVKNTVTGMLSDMKYQDLIIVGRDPRGYITSLETDYAKMSRLESRITDQLKEELSLLQDENMGIPMGMLLRIDALSCVGPGIRIKVKSCEVVETGFVSEYTGEGTDHTRHTIYASVKTKVEIAVPLYNKATEMTVKIPVAEETILKNVTDSQNE